MWVVRWWPGPPCCPGGSALSPRCLNGRLAPGRLLGGGGLRFSREAALPGLTTRPPAAAWPLRHPVPEATAPGPEDRASVSPPAGRWLPSVPAPASRRGQGCWSSPRLRLTVICPDGQTDVRVSARLLSQEPDGVGAAVGARQWRQHGGASRGPSPRASRGKPQDFTAEPAGRAQLQLAGEPLAPRLWTERA